MISKYLLNTEEIVSGKIIELPKFCKKKLREKCKKFYDSITSNGFYTCPYGFTIYYLEEQNIIYNGLIIKQKSNFKKIKPKIIDDRVTSIDEQKFMTILNYELDYSNLKFTDNFIFNIMHELRKLSNLIKRQNDQINDMLSSLRKVDDNDRLIEDICSRNENIRAANQLLISRW